VKAAALLARELERFERANPRSLALAREAQGPLLAGVPTRTASRFGSRAS